MKTQIEQLGKKADERGWVVEPLGPEGLVHQRNVHLVITAPGKVRGNHWHQRGTEVMVVVGPALVRLREDGEIRDIEIPPDEVWRFTIPPGVAHAIKNTGLNPLILLGFNTERHDPARPDVVRDLLLEED